MDALVGSHKLDTYALHNLEKEVRENTPGIIKQIQVKIYEHIADVEHYLKVIIPNLIAHSHINIKSTKTFHITRMKDTSL